MKNDTRGSHSGAVVHGPGRVSRRSLCARNLRARDRTHHNRFARKLVVIGVIILIVVWLISSIGTGGLSGPLLVLD